MIRPVRIELINFAFSALGIPPFFGLECSKFRIVLESARTLKMPYPMIYVYKMPKILGVAVFCVY